MNRADLPTFARFFDGGALTWATRGATSCPSLDEAAIIFRSGSFPMKDPAWSGDYTKAGFTLRSTDAKCCYEKSGIACPE